MTTPGVSTRAQEGRSFPITACVTLMAGVVAAAWAIVPPNDTPAAALAIPPVPAIPDSMGPEAAEAAESPEALMVPAGLSADATADVPADASAAVPGITPVSEAGATPPPAPDPQPPAWAGSLPPAGVAWSPYIDAAASKEGLDPRLFASLVWAESNFDAAAVSNKGAVGLAQVMPTTAADMGVDPANPLQNLAGGAKYLKKNLDRFGRTDLALAAYNAGPTRVAQTGRVPDIYETVEYVGKVLTLYRTLSDTQAQ